MSTTYYLSNEQFDFYRKTVEWLIAASELSPVADSVVYRVLPDGTNWQLLVYSHALKTPRVYMHRSSENITPEEESQELTSFHSWHVFRQQ